MRFASVLRAEPGWKVALVQHPANLIFADVDYWGMSLDGSLSPLDNMYSSLKEKQNYVALVSSEPTKDEMLELKVKCDYIAEKLGWNQKQKVE
jgi:hypothetical protein